MYVYCVQVHVALPHVWRFRYIFPIWVDCSSGVRGCREAQPDLKLALGFRHYLLRSHSSLPDQFGTGTRLNLFHRLGLSLLRNKLIVRIILQVIFARLLDDIECGKDVKSVIDAALDILVLDRLFRSSL